MIANNSYMAVIQKVFYIVAYVYVIIFNYIYTFFFPPSLLLGVLFFVTLVGHSIGTWIIWTNVTIKKILLIPLIVASIIAELFWVVREVMGNYTIGELNTQIILVVTILAKLSILVVAWRKNSYRLLRNQSGNLSLGDL